MRISFAGDRRPSPCTQGVGPLKPAPAHPGKRLQRRWMSAYAGGLGRFAVGDRGALVLRFRPYRAGRFLALFPGLTPFALLFRPIRAGRNSLSLGLS